MAKINANYEAVYILDPSLNEEQIAALVEKFNKIVETNGTVTEVNEWGKRRLAYPINFKNEGYYVLVNFSAAPEFPRELERNFEINENIMRYLVTRVEE